MVRWLYEEKLVKDKELIEHALFFANIDAALEERDQKTRSARQDLLKKMGTDSSFHCTAQNQI